MFLVTAIDSNEDCMLANIFTAMQYDFNGSGDRIRTNDLPGMNRPL